MRLIRLTTNHDAYLRRFYEANPERSAQPYAEQYRALMDDCFGWADFWTNAFAKRGVEMWEPVANAEPAQKAWALEHGTGYTEESWLTDITAAQVKHYEPDVLFVNDYVTFSAGFIDGLRASCPSIKLVLGWCGAPCLDERVLAAYDVVLSNIPAFVRRFRDQGHQTAYMPHAFDRRILERIGRGADTAVPFSFVGSITRREGFHLGRERMLRRLIHEADLRVWSDVRRPGARKRIRTRVGQLLFDAGGVAPGIRRYAKLDERPFLWGDIHRDIARAARPAVFGLAMYRTLRNSSVTLNTHIDAARHEASNMRLFEATGVGTCLMTERQPNLQDFFAPDEEVVTYASVDEAVEKVRYLLGNERVRQQIASAGQRRTLRTHTFDDRAERLEEIIRGKIS